MVVPQTSGAGWFMVIEMMVVGKGEGWAEVGWSEVRGRAVSGSWLLVVGNRKNPLFAILSLRALGTLRDPSLSLIQSASSVSFATLAIDFLLC